MKSFKEITETMLSDSREMDTFKVFQQMYNEITNLFWVNGIQYDSVEMDASEGSIEFSNVEEEETVRFIAERIAWRAQQYGYIVNIKKSEDNLHIRSLVLRPFNEDDLARLSCMESIVVGNYGSLEVEFLPSAEGSYDIKFCGTFDSGSAFEELIEEIEYCNNEECVYSSAFHYRVSDDDEDYVKINI